MQNNNIQLDPWQKDFIKTKGDKILCCGRQVGKSTISALDAGEYAINNPNTKPLVIIAPTERQAYALFTKVLNYLSDNYPAKIINKGKDRPTKSRIKLKTGVEIWCLPVGTSGLGIRFLTIGRLYVDEASRMPEEVWEAVYPALLTTGGDTILLSTPHGAKGEFYRVWMNKDEAYNSFSRFSIDSEKVISQREISKTWTNHQRDKALERIERDKKRMTKRQYAQEYLGHFVDDLHRFFSDELIDEICTIKRPEKRPSGDFYMGCDLARMGGDEITYEVLKKEGRNLIHIENIVERYNLTTQTRNKIIHMNKRYDELKKIYLDSGSGTLGVAIFDMLLEEDEVKRKIVALNNRARPVDYEGKKRTKLLKEDLYNNLLNLMEQRRIKLLDDEEVKESLRSVQYEFIYTQGEPSRLHIFGDYTHVVEGIIRGAWCMKEKDLNIWVRSIKI